MERIIFFISIYANALEFAGIWIAFKTVAKWEARSNLSVIPERPQPVDSFVWARALRILAAREYSTFVVGTGLNLLVAGSGVLLARAVEVLS